MIKKSVLLICLSLLAFPGLIATADDPATIKVDVRLVEVYAAVFDQKGRYLDDLDRGSFELSEDGTPQTITHFEKGVQNISCAILLDTTGSMTMALPRVKNSVVRLIDKLDDNDSVGIFTFDERLFTRQDFTIDKAAAKRAVLRTRAEGGTALFDALSETADELSKRPGKKALVVFTDGDDNASVLNANAAIVRANKLGVPLYSVLEGEAMESPKLKKELEDLSEHTGGVAFQIRNLDKVDGVFEGIANDLRHLYMLGYKPSFASRDGRWRKIDVQIRGSKDYRIRAKQGYFPN